MQHYRLSALGKLEKKISGQWLAVKGEGLPLRWLYPFVEKEQKNLTAVASSLARPAQVLVTTSEALFLSQDGGNTFTFIADRSTISPSAYFTSVAVSEENPDEWIMGTSYRGLYITHNAGKSWKLVPIVLKDFSFGGHYHETINDIAYDLSDPSSIYFAYGPYGKVALLNIKSGSIQPILPLPTSEGILSLSTTKTDLTTSLIAQTSSTIWYYSNNSWLKYGLVYRTLPLYFSGTRWQKTKDKRGLYVTAWTASNLARLRKHFLFIKQHGMNAVVIDFKDDAGYIMYNSQVKMAREARAIRPILNVEAIRALADELGIHLIARFVLFKDEKLYNYADNSYALWDKKSDAPWGHRIKNNSGQMVQREYWVDLFSPDVWKYNLQIAQELQSLGIDEIQFDYIRLPSDGPLHTIFSRHNLYGMKAVDALESFLKKSREVLNLPISINVFGYNGWFLTNGLGQNIERLALYVDAISPMTYPSHYHATFLGGIPYLKKAHLLYKVGSDRAVFYTKGQTFIRQYVQAFLLGPERSFSEKSYTDYLKSQLEGVYGSKGSGFLLWNASNNYYMVKRDLAPRNLSK